MQNLSSEKNVILKLNYV